MPETADLSAAAGAVAEAKAAEEAHRAWAASWAAAEAKAVEEAAAAAKAEEEQPAKKSKGPGIFNR